MAAAAFGVWFMSMGTYGTFSVFFVPVSTEFGWSRAETSLALSIGGIVVAILALGMGWLTDRLGPRIVVTVFGSFLGIAFLLLSQVHTLWQFQLYYALVMSIGFSTASVPMMATVARWFAKRRGLMSGIVQSGAGLGGFIFAPLAGWVIINYGWRTAYVVLGIIVLVGIILLGLLLRRDPRDMGLLPDGTTEVAPTRPSHVVGLSLWQAMPTSQFWILAGLFFVYGFCRTTFITHIVPHVQDLGFSLADAANVVAIINVSSIFGRIGMGRAADMMGIKPALMISYAMTTVDMIWGLTTTSLWGLYLYAFIFGLSWGAQAVLRYPAAASLFGLRAAGLLMGVMYIFENLLGGASGVYLGGYAFDVFGSYKLVYWIGIGISFTGVMLAGMIKKKSE